MRTECKNFESRSYPNGDTVRKCNLDLAPDAPWRCPDGCASFERRLADVAWTHGTLVVPPTPPEPAGLDDGSAAAVLDEAEDILNSVGPIGPGRGRSRAGRHRSPACSSASSAASADRSSRQSRPRGIRAGRRHALRLDRSSRITPTAVGEFRRSLRRIASVSAFSPDAVKSAGSPWSDWSAFRLAAAERFVAAPLPSADEEIWRYSRIDQLDLDAVRPARVDHRRVERPVTPARDRRRRTRAVRRRRRPTCSPS